jgi:hypothetical protein
VGKGGNMMGGKSRRGTASLGKREDNRLLDGR